MKHQLPGRQEALRAVLKGDKSPELRHMAGMAKATQRQPPAKVLETFTFSSGIEKLTPAERAALPF